MVSIQHHLFHLFWEMVLLDCPDLLMILSEGDSSLIKHESVEFQELADDDVSTSSSRLEVEVGSYSIHPDVVADARCA